MDKSTAFLLLLSYLLKLLSSELRLTGKRLNLSVGERSELTCTEAAAMEPVQAVARVDEAHQLLRNMTAWCLALAILMSLPHGSTLLLNQRSHTVNTVVKN